MTQSKKLLLLLPVLVFFLNPGTSFADRPELAVSNISPLLQLANAPVVIREDERVFTWRDEGRGRLEVRMVITIMNSDGRSSAVQHLPYDSFTSVGRISGRLYDKDGERIGRLRNRHITDRSAVSGFSLAEDARVQVVEFHHDEYPYTYEIEYRYDFEGLISFPQWSPLNRRASLEKSTYTVEVPSDLEIRYTSRNLGGDADPVVMQENGLTRYKWSISDRPMARRPQYGPQWHEVAPNLMVQTTTFEFGGKVGSLEDWNSYGRWFHSLWDGRDVLPQSFEEEILQLVDGVEDKREVINVLYRYLQQNTRYVSIQLGIGGFQTETAEQTLRTRHGDCKALTNYLRAMLRIVGIESWPALIRSGDPADDINPELPNQRFNHVILCVPVQQEETEEQEFIWVEATSNTFAPGYIGLGNSGKHVLLFNESGGTLKKTPELTADDNFQHRTAEVEIGENGTAVAHVSTNYGGAQHESVRSAGMLMSPREQANFLDSHIRLSDFLIESHQFIIDENQPDRAGLDLELTLPGYASVMGSRIFLNPNLMERRRYQVEENTNRMTDIHIRYPYFDTDEIRWILPQNYMPEAIPEPVSETYEFGHYISSIDYDEQAHQLIYRRELRLKSSRIDAKHYNDFRRMLNQAVRSDGGQVVLVRK